MVAMMVMVLSTTFFLSRHDPASGWPLAEQPLLLPAGVAHE
jgi:hypothetical protein